MAVTIASPLSRSEASPWKRRFSFLQDATLVCISALFVWAHATHAIQDRSIANVFFATEQAFLVVMFLTRRRTNTTSQKPLDWFTATIGGWLALAMRPHETGGTATLFGAGMQVFGLTFVLICFATLGKSFGIVAANRGLKVNGPYRLVRHPIYVGHTITMTGFVIANAWWPNIAILATVTVFQVLRIQAEERVLSATSDYQSYQRQVRWRLVPGVF
jgi:protein-S-isoprenylcysteine O-methyltransferase Ste14